MVTKHWYKAKLHVITTKALYYPQAFDKRECVTL